MWHKLQRIKLMLIGAVFLRWISMRWVKMNKVNYDANKVEKPRKSKVKNRPMTSVLQNRQKRLAFSASSSLHSRKEKLYEYKWPLKINESVFVLPSAVSQYDNYFSVKVTTKNVSLLLLKLLRKAKKELKLQLWKREIN